MTANVSIITAVKDGILRVPNAALRFTPSQKGTAAPGKRGAGVWIVENKKPKRLPVKTGISDGIYTEVVSGEVKEGDQVIVAAEGDKKAANARGRGFFR
jgi:HlyD family secretion protein